MKISILGDSGLLGQALTQYASGELRYDVLGVSTHPFTPHHLWKPLLGQYRHLSLDLSRLDSGLEQSLTAYKPDILINCAAIVNLAACEQDTQRAKLIHEDLVRKTAVIAGKLKARLIQISTDQVFDGLGKQPYSEEDRTSPLNVYGQSKLAGEKIALSESQKNLVLRTNIVGFRDRAAAPTFAEWLFDSLAMKTPLTLFKDYVTSPIHVEDFSRILFFLAESAPGGLYHVASNRGISKYDFGRIAAKKAGLAFEHVTEGEMRSKPLQPPRPAYLELNIKKAEGVSGQSFPAPEDTIEKLVRDYHVRKEKADAAAKD